SELQGYKWDQRDFLYLPGENPGFSQTHFHQWASNDGFFLEPDTANRQLQFAKQIRNISLLNRYLNIVENLRPQYVEEGTIRNEFLATFRDRNVHLFAVVIDSLSGNYLEN